MMTDTMRTTSSVPVRRGSSAFILISSVLLLILSQSMIASAASSGPSVESGSDIIFDTGGHIREFTIWITFPESVMIDMAERSIEIYYPGNSFRISDPGFPFESNWSDDHRTIFIRSGRGGISDERIYLIGVSISTPIRTESGENLWEDSSSIELSFGNPNEIDLGMTFWEIAGVFFLPIIFLVIAVLAIEIILRLTYKEKDVETGVTTTETLLHLIDRS
ncbi:MAG: hypothetical protein ACMUIG_02700, partial [Thermoplasmatota archaeon]